MLRIPGLNGFGDSIQCPAHRFRMRENERAFLHKQSAEAEVYFDFPSARSTSLLLWPVPMRQILDNVTAMTEYRGILLS
jgi:hypothetical protein